MIAISGAIVCFAYILGLLLTGLPWLGELPSGAIVLLVAGVLAAGIVPRYWRTGSKSKVWLIAGLIGSLAVLYFHWRVPQPGVHNISKLLSNVTNELTPAQVFAVQGRIATPPHLTRSQKIQFELEATQAQKITTARSTPAIGSAATASATTSSAETVTGKVYVTVPLLQGTGLYPGQIVTVSGSLYQPKPATNPGGFDFEKYLAQQGIFAGLNGKKVDFPSSTKHTPPLLWSIRQRILRAQVTGLGMPEGALVSAMVMGHRAVDVPYDLRDRFRIAGLAHALAASGAQVSMLVGVVLALTQRFSPRTRLILGTIVLLAYLGLTGLEPAVLRAGIMGFVALFALSADRKVKPLGAILFTATLLLLWNPLWVWDLGFQLSFLATMGLLVTVPVLQKWLDWLPTGIASLLAVPIAAYLWTLPLLLFVFGIVSPYSILVNILASPLIALISIGGMGSAVAALVYPPAGSLTAWMLHHPTFAFIKLAELGSQLPGHSWAVGRITIAQMLVLYGFVALIWVWRRSQPYWWIICILSMGIVTLPSAYAATNQLRVTALATTGNPVLVIQDRGKVSLINSGNEADAHYTVLPFLQQQGINQIDWAIALHLNASEIAGWQRLLNTESIQTFYSDPDAGKITVNHPAASRVTSVSTNSLSTNSSANSPTKPTSSVPYQTLLNQIQLHRGNSLRLTINRPIQLNSVTTQLSSLQPSILQMQIGNRTWLLLDQLPPLEKQAAMLPDLPAAQVLWWSGSELSPQILQHIKPEVAIAAGRSVSPETGAWLEQNSVTLYYTNRDGAVQWTSQQGFTTTLGTE